MGKYGETPGDIGLRVLSRSQLANGCVVVRVGGLQSTMAPLRTNELERLAHVLRKTDYMNFAETWGFTYEFGRFNLGRQDYEKSGGFVYTFGNINFGE